MNSLAHDISAYAPPAGTLAMWWLGQGSFVYKSPGGIVLAVDPYLSNSASELKGRPDLDRLRPLPLRAEELACSVVVVTHDHLDHADPQTLPGLLAANPGAVLLGPPLALAAAQAAGVAPTRMQQWQRGEGYRAGDLELHAVYAEHTADSIGIVVRAGPTGVYQTGDTGPSPRLAGEAGPMRPAGLVCVANGHFGNLDPEAAAALAAELDVAVAIPCHYDLFPAARRDPAEFVEAMAAIGLGARARVMEFCERLVLGAGGEVR